MVVFSPSVYSRELRQEQALLLEPWVFTTDMTHDAADDLPFFAAVDLAAAIVADLHGFGYSPDIASCKDMGIIEPWWGCPIIKSAPSAINFRSSSVNLNRTIELTLSS